MPKNLRLTSLSKFLLPSLKPDALDADLFHSTRLLLQAGYIRAGSQGFVLLPMGQRVLNKLKALVHAELELIGGLEVSLPTLQSIVMWKQSGRYFHQDLFHVDESTILAPTHEEEVTRLASQVIHSYKQLPTILFQTGAKYRKEQRPRGGLLRTREFIMTDAYSFCQEQQKFLVYERVRQAFGEVFRKLGLQGCVQEADSGDIGGSLSHEWLLEADVGDDKVKESGRSAIEVAHTFILDDIYSKPFGATYKDTDGNVHNLSMGCYGIGLTRLMAAIQEHHRNEFLVWPPCISPFDGILIPKALDYSHDLFNGEYLLDDRFEKSMGMRLMEARLSGIRPIYILHRPGEEPEEIK